MHVLLSPQARNHPEMREGRKGERERSMFMHGTEGREAR